MSEPDQDALRREASRWVSRATDDRQMIGLALSADRPLARPAAFHAQQAVEKLLKALLVLAAQPVPKTHDLTYLARLLGLPPGVLGIDVALLTAITPWVARTRYPGPEDAGDPTAEDIAGALPQIDALFAALAARLDGAGMA